jgi:C-terminal processing protease CtpA/Prc
MGTDDDADELPPSPPPPRTERPWRHPSELDERSLPTKRPNIWIVLTASALVGTVVAVVMVGLVRELGSSGGDNDAATDAALAPTSSREETDASDTLNPGTVSTLGSTLAQAAPSATPWLGIEGTDVDGGVLVTGVTAEGPAATAGVRPGDLIVAAEREPVATMADLRTMLAHFEPGSIFVLDVVRTHYRVRLMAVLGVRS